MDTLQLGIIAVAILPKNMRPPQHRFFKESGFKQKKRIQYSSHPPVRINKGVNGLKLIMYQSGTDKRTHVGIFINKLFQS